MWWPFRSPERPALPPDVQDRLETVERLVAKLARDLLDLDDYTTRQVAKLLKRHQRAEGGRTAEGEGYDPARNPLPLSEARKRLGR